MLWSIAWKNIWRNKTRSMVVIIAIMLGLFGGLFTSAFMIGMSEQRIKSAIQDEISNIQIHDTAFILNKELSDTIISGSTICRTIDSLPQVKAYSKRLKVMAMANTANASAGLMLTGIDPLKESEVTSLYTKINDTMGNYFSDNKSNSIVIGKKLADKLKVKLKSKIVLTFQNDTGTLVYANFKVRGIYQTSNTSFDEMFAYVKYEDLSKLLEFKGNKEHEIAIALHSDTTNNTVKRKLLKAYPNQSIQSWKEISPDLGMMSDSMGQTLYILMIIILLALCFSIINTMMMAILERTRELGMLMAVGMSRQRIFIMIMLETIMLSLTGAFLGMILSAISIHYFGIYGIDLSAFAKGLEAVGINTMVYPKLDTPGYIGVTILVIITGIISSIFPARKALKLNPVDAIRTL